MKDDGRVLHWFEYMKEMSGIRDELLRELTEIEG